MTKATKIPAVEVEAQGYSASVTADGKVSISNERGEWAGDGRWDADACRIEDCAADLGDDVYEALEETIAEAIDEAATVMTASEYALARGWSRTEIEATAARGVADEDVEALATTTLTPEALLEWCRAQVEAAL